MDFEVLGQVIAAGKLLLADDALVRLDPGVGAAVAGQLVRAGEPAGRTDHVTRFSSVSTVVMKTMMTVCHSYMRTWKSEKELSR